MNDLLYNYRHDVFSDNGEDGINEAIFKYLNITEGVVLEIGAWDGFQSSNCANLWSKNKKFKGILVESTNRLRLSLEDEYDNIACFKSLISIENTLEDVIDECKFEVDNDNFVLASIDVDGDDLNVARSLGKYKPLILILESAGTITSIKEIIDFSNNLGYQFIGMSGYPGRHMGNLYFVRNDYEDKFDICKESWKKRGIILSEGLLY